MNGTNNKLYKGCSDDAEVLFFIDCLLLESLLFNFYLAALSLRLHEITSPPSLLCHYLTISSAMAGRQKRNGLSDQSASIFGSLTTTKIDKKHVQIQLQLLILKLNRENLCWSILYEISINEAASLATPSGTLFVSPWAG